MADRGRHGQQGRKGPEVPVQDIINRGLDALNLALPEGGLECLAEYVELLVKWNRVYNLTSVRKSQDMVTRHILDSLVVIPYLNGGRLLDVGTGAGLPGIPLAIARPELQVTLLDSSAKKLRFVQQTVAELGLANVEAVNVRVEEFKPSQPFDTVISRAFSSTGEFYNMVKGITAPGGKVLAMKGVYPVAEMAVLPEAAVDDVVKLKVPGLDADRHLVIMTTGTPA